MDNTSETFRFKQALGKEFEIRVENGKPICVSCSGGNCKHEYFAVTNPKMIEELKKNSVYINQHEVDKIKENWKKRNPLTRFFR